MKQNVRFHVKQNKKAVISHFVFGKDFNVVWKNREFKLKRWLRVPFFKYLSKFFFESTLGSYIWYHLKALNQEHILNIHSWVQKRTKNFLEAPEVENFQNSDTFEIKKNSAKYYSNVGDFK